MKVQFAIMPLDDVLDQMQAKPSPVDVDSFVALDPEERLKQPGLQVFRDTEASIFNLKVYSVIFIAQSHPNFAAFWRILDRVTDQIDDSLVQLRGISHYEQGILWGSQRKSL